MPVFIRRRGASTGRRGSLDRLGSISVNPGNADDNSSHMILRPILRQRRAILQVLPTILSSRIFSSTSTTSDLSRILGKFPRGSGLGSGERPSLGKMSCVGGGRVRNGRGGRRGAARARTVGHAVISTPCASPDRARLDKVGKAEQDASAYRRPIRTTQRSEGGACREPWLSLGAQSEAPARCFAAILARHGEIPKWWWMKVAKGVAEAVPERVKVVGMGEDEQAWGATRAERRARAADLV